jgi:hypothetical protein
MKKLIGLVLALLAASANAQTFTVQNLQVNGTSAMTGALTAGAAAFSSTTTFPTVAQGNNTTSGATSAFVALDKDCASIIDHGGDPTDTNDNSAALTNTIAASSNLSGQVCVVFPPGTYKFTGSVTYTFPTSISSVKIMGAGADATRLDFTANSTFLKFNYIGAFNAVHIRDLTITTTQTGGSAIAVYLNQTASSIPDPAVGALSDISNVVLRGSDGYGVSNYWQSGVYTIGVSNVDFVSDYIMGASSGAGYGVNLNGTSSLPSVVYNFFGGSYTTLADGIVYGPYVQGLQVTSTNFTNDAIGIDVPAGEIGLDELSVTNSQFSTLTAGVGINVASGVAATIISNSLFIVHDDSSANGIIVAGCAYCQFTGNSFASSSASVRANTGLSFTGTETPTVVTGNSFNGFTDGIFISTLGTGVNVQSNAYNSNGTNVGNLGSGNTIGGGSQ